MDFSITTEGNKVKISIEVEKHNMPDIIKTLEHIDKLVAGDFSKLDRELIALLKEGRGLSAVKHYKDTTGESLMESKAYVDKLKEKIL